MLDDLDALFDSMDDFKEDLFDFTIAGVGGLGASIAWGYIDANIVSKIPVVGTSVYGRAIAQILAGVAGGALLSKMNKNLATGVAVVLAYSGIKTLAQQVMPNLPISGVDDLGLTWYEQKLLKESQRRGMAGAPTMVEEVSGLNAATATVEQVAGLDGIAATFS